MIYEGFGQNQCMGSAVIMSLGLQDTQQICADNSVDAGMRCAFGFNQSLGTARIIR